MLIATLFTDILEHRSPGTPTEGGRYELEVRVKKDEMLKSGGPREFCFRQIGLHLGQAIQDTGVPREYWYAKFPEAIQKEFNLPTAMKMSA